MKSLFNLILLFLVISIIGCTYPNLAIYNYNGKQRVIKFLDKDEAFDYIKKSSFIKNMNPLNISIRMDKDIPFDKDSVILQYKEFIYKNLKDWSGYEKNIVGGASEAALENLSSLAPEILPDTLRLIKTSMRLEFNAFFTVNNAICVPASVVWPIFFKGMIKNKMAHELFHIYSRNNKSKRDSLYKIFNFYAADTIDTGENLASKMIVNPDVHSNNYALRIKDSTGQIKNLFLAVQLDEKKYNSDRGIISFLGVTNIFGYFRPALYEIKDNGNNVFSLSNTQNPNMLDWSSFKNEYSFNCGCLSSGSYFPEEVAADAFTFFFRANEDFKMFEDCSKKDKEKIEYFMKIIRER